MGRVSLLSNGYRDSLPVPGIKAAAGWSLPLAPKLKKEYSYASTPFLVLLVVF